MIDQSLRTTFLLLLFLAGASLAQAQMCENRCLSFDGEGDAVKLLSNPIANQNEFTVEAWVFSSAGGAPAGTCDLNLKTLFYLGDYNANKIELGECDGILHIDWSPSGPAEPLEAAPVNIRDGWRHVALVRNGNSLKVFLDFEEVFSASISASPNYTAFLVGHGGDPAVPTPGEDWEGLVDEVRVWESAKSASDLEQYKRCALSGNLPDDLLAYWPMNEGLPEGNNLLLTELQDATGNGHNGLLTSPPQENFLLTGSISNFVCSDFPTGMEFHISQVFLPGDFPGGICSGAPANFCITENGAPINGAGGFSVEWEYLDGASWQSLSSDPGFSGLCFTVPPGNANLMTDDCAAAPGAEEKTFRPILTFTESSGTVCTWILPEQSLQVCCPITEATLEIDVTPAASGAICEGEEIVLEATLTTDAFATPPGDGAEVTWSLNGVPLPEYDNMLSFAHEITAGGEDLCLEAVIAHCSCAPVSVSECIETDARPTCGQIESKTDPSVLVPDQTTPGLFHICPGEDAVLGMADAGAFEDCSAQWQYMFQSEGEWKDLGSANSNQQTNILPVIPPPVSPFEWPAGEKCIIYRIECKPLTGSSSCEPCYSNEITICLKTAPEPDGITGESPLCGGDQTTISVDNPDPELTYTWFFNGMEVSPEGPEYEASQSGCYWAVISNGCESQQLETPKFCLEVCEIEPIIECPLSPNPCPNAGDPVTLNACSSKDSCAGILEFAWEDGDGNPLGSGCSLTHTPETAGTEYVLTVTNPATGCSATTSMLIVPCMGN